MENNKPAFPTKVTYENDKPAAYQCGDISFQEIGLTKREMIATQMDVRSDIADYSLGFLTQLIGRERPALAAGAIELIKWDAEVEAVIRIIKADALLNELSKS